MVERWLLNFTDSIERSLKRIAVELERLNNNLDNMTNNDNDTGNDQDEHDDVIPEVLRTPNEELPEEHSFYHEALASMDANTHPDAPDPHRAIAWLITDFEKRIESMPKKDIGDYEKGRLDGLRSALMSLRGLEFAIRHSKLSEMENDDDE